MDFSAEEKLGASNFACMLAYYPDRSSPLLVKIGCEESWGWQHYFRHKHPFQLLFRCKMRVAIPTPVWIRNARSSKQMSKPAATVGGHSELGAAASTKAVWWDLHLASLLMHLLWSPYVIRQTIIFSSCFFLLSFFLLLLLFFPRLISAVGDWMSTILWHMVWP